MSKARRVEEAKTMLKNHQDFTDDLEGVAQEVVDTAIKIHKTLGPGYLEKVYEDCFDIELSKRNINFERQKQFTISYEDHIIPSTFYVDLIVENQIIIELKATERMSSLYEAQLYSYMKMAGMPLGFIMNFNMVLMKDGIKRFKNNHLRSFETSR